MPQHGEHAWLELVRTQVLRRDMPCALELLSQALREYPASTALRRTQAGILQLSGRAGQAEAIFRDLLEQSPADAASAFSLARILKEEGRTAAAAKVLSACFTAGTFAADLAISAIELLDETNRKHDAALICESAIAAHPDDTRLHAYAGMLAIQLGEFERARLHYTFTLERDPRAFEWHVPIGLSNTLRYRNPDHPDFALFRAGLARTDLSDLARAELHFALGKANDDIGDYERAARHFLEGNAIRKRIGNWSRKAWRRLVEARLASKPLIAAAKPVNGFTPVFILGMPRTGTTLLAELLSRYPEVRNRGELPWLARLAQQPDLCGQPDAASLQQAAHRYLTQARQDDAADARWFLDKQPLNFRYVDLALAMFPDAKIIHCRRNPRDTALSLWMQCFLEDVQGYAYDFDDIALVMQDERKLMEHWRALYPDSIETVRYEELVASPEATTAAKAAWMRLDTTRLAGADLAAAPAGSISTASLWQARQPIHSNSVDRWKNYAPFIPQLASTAFA